MVLANESPLKRKFDAFDIENIDAFEEDYKKMALGEDPRVMGKLLIEDWKWRKSHGQNVVASWNGLQGKGKSRPAIYASCILGDIFGVPFCAENIFWDLTKLQESIKDLPPRSTIFKDEHRHTQSGYLAKQEAAHLNDLIEQLREPKQINFLFASVFNEIHADFFRFEAMNTDWDNDKTKPPKGFFSMLSTPRYTDSDAFVWRGMVYFPMPPLKIDKVYSERKAEAQKELTSQDSNRLSSVELIAKKIFEKRHKELVRETKTGLKIPLQSDLLMLVIQKEPGIGGLTIPVLKMLIAEIRKHIEEFYKEENQRVENALVLEKEKAKEEAEILRQEIELAKAEQRKARYDLTKQKIEEMKASRLLKERILALKLKEVSEKRSDSDKNRAKLAENQDTAMKQA